MAKARSGAKRKTVAGRNAKRANRKPPPTKRAKTARTTSRRAKASRATKRTAVSEARTNETAAKPSVPDTPLTSAAAAVGRVLGRTVEAVGRLPFRTSDRDALKLLENDHRRLEMLLRRGEETTQRAMSGRTRLLDTLTAELQVHEEIEEKILYPALKAHAEATESVLEGYQEHHVADVLIKELHALPPDDERWGAKFKVLKENIEHHIEEEEGEMFRIARSVLTRAEREQLGERMQAMKMERQ